MLMYYSLYKNAVPADLRLQLKCEYFKLFIKKKIILSLPDTSKFIVFNFVWKYFHAYVKYAIQIIKINILFHTIDKFTFLQVIRHRIKDYSQK